MLTNHVVLCLQILMYSTKIFCFSQHDYQFIAILQVYCYTLVQPLAILLGLPYILAFWLLPAIGTRRVVLFSASIPLYSGTTTRHSSRTATHPFSDLCRLSVRARRLFSSLQPTSIPPTLQRLICVLSFHFLFPSNLPSLSFLPSRLSALL